MGFYQCKSRPPNTPPISEIGDPPNPFKKYSRTVADGAKLYIIALCEVNSELLIVCCY